MRFVQISDVHLGASLATSALGLAPAQQEQRRRELGAALRQACRLALDEGAGVLLLPGDLFDHEGVSRDTLAEAAGTLAECGLPVLIAPGNHDFYSPSSYYQPDFVRSRHQFDWPANVHLFAGDGSADDGGWSRKRLPGVPGVAFTGIAFTTHSVAGDRPLQRLPAPEPGVQNVLVFHGSRSGHAPPGKQAVLPFSDDELERSGYDYAALGHYHSHSRIESSSGRLLGAYSGCPAGRGLDECGPKGVLVGELTPAGSQVELVPVDGRTIHDLAIDCSGIAYQAALLQRIEQRLLDAGCRDADIINLRLHGRPQRGLDLRLPDAFMAGRCFHFKLDQSGLLPDYDLERYRTPPGSETTEGRFVTEIDRRLAVTTDDGERQRLQRALCYGLDALIDGRVLPRQLPAGRA